MIDRSRSPRMQTARRVVHAGHAAATSASPDPRCGDRWPSGPSVSFGRLPVSRKRAVGVVTARERGESSEEAPQTE